MDDAALLSRGGLTLSFARGLIFEDYGVGIGAAGESKL
jgi:hypothetical protein